MGVGEPKEGGKAAMNGVFDKEAAANSTGGEVARSAEPRDASGWLARRSWNRAKKVA